MINWFPGHMNKTLKQMHELNKLCNCFVYVLDARSPKACLNPEFVKVIGDKPIVYVLNKSDKANDIATTKWKQYFNTLPMGTKFILYRNFEGGQVPLMVDKYIRNNYNLKSSFDKYDLYIK